MPGGGARDSAVLAAVRLVATEVPRPVVNGQVVGPDGKPVAGAEVVVVASRRSQPAIQGRRQAIGPVARARPLRPARRIPHRVGGEAESRRLSRSRGDRSEPGFVAIELTT